MNGKQIIILIIALVLCALIVWNALPIEFPWLVVKMLKLFLKLFAVLALAVFAYIYAGRR